MQDWGLEPACRAEGGGDLAIWIKDCQRDLGRMSEELVTVAIQKEVRILYL